jgi:hypothetical protein
MIIIIVIVGHVTLILIDTKVAVKSLLTEKVVTNRLLMTEVNA